MKKGDVISREILLDKGVEVLHNVASPESAKSYMENVFFQEYGVIPDYALQIDTLNPTTQSVVLLSPVTNKEEAKVVWVIDNEASIQTKDGNYRIINLDEEKDWTVTQEGIPAYQSSVDNMSDEQLRQAIDDLRNKRATLPQPKVRKTREVNDKVDKSDPMAVALASLPEDKKLALMKKLGMID